MKFVIKINLKSFPKKKIAIKRMRIKFEWKKKHGA